MLAFLFKLRNRCTGLRKKQAARSHQEGFASGNFV
jgi:hypothetical protein